MMTSRLAPRCARSLWWSRLAGMLAATGLAVPAWGGASDKGAAAPVDSAEPVNDAAYGGRASDLLPAEPTRALLRSAIITITDAPLRGAWQVRADYEIENGTAEPLALTLLFPEELCPKDAECTESAGAFSDIVTLADGKELQPQVRGPAPSPWAKHPGRTFAYQLSLRPQQRLRLRHQYQLDRSRGNDWAMLRYLSSAGRWAGPIERVELKVELKKPVLYVMYPRAFSLRGVAERRAAGGSGTVSELVLTAERLAARTDLALVLPADSINHTAPDQGSCPGIDGEQDADELRQTLREYPPALLRACRNHLYALHGYPFRDPRLRARYYETRQPLPAWARPDVYTITARPENPQFRDSWLTAGERAYLSAVVARERELSRAEKP